MSGFRNSAGTDLDGIFYTDWSNAGGIGFRQSDGNDLGNKYTISNVLGYAIGYRASDGTDLGYLRGSEPIVPILSAANFTWVKALYGYSAGGDSEGGYTVREGPFAFVYNFYPRLSNYVPTHSYTITIGHALWTSSGASRICAYVYTGVDISQSNSQFVSNKFTYSNRYDLPSNNGGRCGNRHSSDGNASDTAGGGARYQYITLPYTDTFNLSICERMDGYWNTGTYAKVKFYVTDTTTGNSTGAWESAIQRCVTRV